MEDSKIFVWKMYSRERRVEKIRNDSYPVSSRKFNIDDIRLFKYWGVGKSHSLIEMERYLKKLKRKLKQQYLIYIRSRYSIAINRNTELHNSHGNVIQNSKEKKNGRMKNDIIYWQE